MPFRGKSFFFSLPLPTPYPLKITSSLPAENTKRGAWLATFPQIETYYTPCTMQGFFYERNEIYDSEIEKEKQKGIGIYAQSYNRADCI